MEKETSKKDATMLTWSVAAVISLSVFVVAACAASITNGYVLSVLWGWSAAQYGAPEVDWLAFAIAYLGVRSLLVSPYGKRDNAELWWLLVVPHIRAGGILCLAWLLMYFAGTPA